MAVRVLVVDDSDLCRMVLKDILEADPGLEVVGEAGDGVSAVDLVERLRPDVVTMDIQMPGMDGLETIEAIMGRQPVPILVVTSQPAGPGSALVFEAIHCGAMDVAEKPADGDERAAADIRARLRELAGVPPVLHPRRARRPAAPPGPRILAVWDGAASPREGDQGPVSSWPAVAVAPRVVGVGASAGGPAAVASLLEPLPADFPACVVVVQHLAQGFTEPFVRYLSQRVRMPVTLVREAAPCQPGTVLVAPDGRHLLAVPGGSAFAVVDGPEVEGHKPSVTTLFRSLAAVHGPAAMGVLLTGMGRDGADGLKEIRDRGGMTLAQDQATSAVWGMPQAAVELGAVTRVLPLDLMPAALVQAAAHGKL
jgi:two-component system chemotaxis response regulator CheB